MKLNRAFIFLFLVAACTAHENYNEKFPQGQPDEWYRYEGRIPLTDKTSLYMNMALKPSSDAGDGSYELDEFIEEDGSQTQVASFKGAYSTYFMGATDGPVEIHFHNSAQIAGVKRIYPSENKKRIREEQFRKKDLIVSKQGDDALIVLGYDHQPVSAESKYLLNRRVSPVFTVEGRFAHVGDSSVFYEMNTEQVWPVSKLGSYDQAIRQYHQLANMKNEGIYLKGTAFVVNLPVGRHRTQQAIVFKKVINMSSNPQ